ncbi:diguanylate cyclase domain-containing protein [Sulfuriflexus sp.]|uniref:sensor domain-containing diguanylate cyclase n=1 Tax=Sulfuriflexus sp. TaxID=2015443 RepID=UPI0028CE8E78|nr:diguanylate cyclase [Sulfuriflexus sp.]MDT8405201.1 diguanylate cyclase [Sulfuriflexus sp.]
MKPPQHVCKKFLWSCLSQPVYRLLLAGLLVVAIIPIGVLSAKLYQNAWDNAWREISEKHRLLAENLASPIHIYINDHKAMLKLVATSIQRDIRQQQGALADYTHTLLHAHGFRSLTLVGLDGKTITGTADEDTFAGETGFIKTRDSGQSELSNIKPSPIDDKPTLILSEPVYDSEGRLRAVLLGELSITLIEQLRSKIKFGIKGHSAIVDKTGHVIAHPNPDWMIEMRDLSHLSVVKEMMAGRTGVTEFYSPFIKQDMVAGYTAVPEVGWGIMVPQPKAEVAAQVTALLTENYRWGLFGLFLSVALVIPLVSWITRPINRLATAANSLAKNDFKGELPQLSDFAPREIRQLGSDLQLLVGGLQHSHTMINALNESLQHRVSDATSQLRDANMQLTLLAQEDHLTTLSNRRHFETLLQESLETAPDHQDTRMCLMLIDIDNFKSINDTYGHAAGDTVLSHIANLLKTIMRPGDLTARYGGDEFVVQMNCMPEIGRKRAQDIRTAVEQSGIFWQEQRISVTVSIGVLYTRANGIKDIDNLMRLADTAMYEAKNAGRNRIVEIHNMVSV